MIIWGFTRFYYVLLSNDILEIIRIHYGKSYQQTSIKGWQRILNTAHLEWSLHLHDFVIVCFMEHVRHWRFFFNRIEFIRLSLAFVATAMFCLPLHVSCSIVSLSSKIFKVVCSLQLVLIAGPYGVCIDPGEQAEPERRLSQGCDSDQTVRPKHKVFQTCQKSQHGWHQKQSILIYIVWKQNVARRLLNLLPSVVTLLVQIVSSCRFLNREIMGNLWKSTITVSMSFLLWGVCPRRGWWADVSRLQGPQIEALRHCVSLRTFADNRTLQDGTFQHRG